QQPQQDLPDNMQYGLHTDSSSFSRPHTFRETERAHRKGAECPPVRPESIFARASKPCACGALLRGVLAGLGAGGLFGVVLVAGGDGFVLTEQQTLVFVQLLLTAAEVDSHGGQCTGDGGQRCDDGDQTGFLNRSSTLLFTRKAFFQVMVPGGKAE